MVRIRQSDQKSAQTGRGKCSFKVASGQPATAAVQSPLGASPCLQLCDGREWGTSQGRYWNSPLGTLLMRLARPSSDTSKRLSTLKHSPICRGGRQQSPVQSSAPLVSGLTFAGIPWRVCPRRRHGFGGRRRRPASSSATPTPAPPFKRKVPHKAREFKCSEFRWEGRVEAS